MEDTVAVLIKEIEYFSRIKMFAFVLIGYLLVMIFDVNYPLSKANGLPASQTS